nr:FtsX-like permease family protein [Candidatus Njordarchaeota archaeon]
MRAMFLSAWLAKRHFSRRKLRNSLITLAVALSVALIVSSSIASQSISAQVVSTVRSTGADVDLIVRKVTAEPFNESLLNIVANQNSVVNDSGIVAPRYAGKCIMSGAQVPLNPVSVVGVDPNLEGYFGFSNSSLLPLASGANVIATDDIATAFSIRQGYSIRLGIDLANGTSRHLDLTVASIVHIERKGFTTALIININKAQWLFATPQEITVIVVKLNDVQRTMTIKGALSQSLNGYQGMEIVAPKEKYISNIMEIVSGFTVGLNAVSAISLMAAVMLTINCLLMAANERRREMGVLRAVGSSRGSLFRVFIFEGTIHGAIGATIGIFLGIVLSTAMTLMVSSVTGYIPTNLIIAPQTLLFSLLVGMIVTIIASLYPALVASTTPAAKAMKVQFRTLKERRISVALTLLGSLFILGGAIGSLIAWSWVLEVSAVFAIILGTLFTFSGLVRQLVRGLGRAASPILKSNRTVTVRNAARNRRRTSLTMGVISIGITFVIFVGSIQGSLTYGINDFLYRQVVTDIMIRPQTSVNVTDVEALGSIQGVSNFSYCEFCFTSIGPVGSSVRGYNVTAIAGVNTETFASVSSIDLKAPELTNISAVMNMLSISNRSIVLSTKVAADLNVTVGDNVTVLIVGGHYANLTVIALFYGSGFIEYGDVTLDVVSLMSFEALRHYFNLPEAVGNFRTNTDGLILVKVTNDEKPSDVAERIRSSGRLGPATELDILTSESVTTAFRTALGEIVLLFQMLLIVSLLIALLGLSTTMLMSVTERRREIGILRAIGMTRNEVLRAVLGEALILGVGGLVMGFINALLLSLIFIKAIASFGLYLPFIFPVWEVVYAILATIIISLLSGSFPARSMSKLKIVEAIKYE